MTTELTQCYCWWYDVCDNNAAAFADDISLTLKSFQTFNVCKLDLIIVLVQSFFHYCQC